MPHRRGPLAAVALVATLLATLFSAPIPAAAQEVEATFRLRAIDGFRNVYFITLPESGGIDDVANSGNFGPCDIDVTGPDGIINADDIACTLWGGGDPNLRVGTFSISQYEPERCSFVSRVFGTHPFRPGEHAAVGDPFVPDLRRGFMIEVTGGHDATVRIAAPCEASEPPLVVEGTAGLCRSDREFEILGLPYEMGYETGLEILCGLRGVDWNDADGDGRPDECIGGLYDGSGVMSVAVFDNDPETSPETDNRFRVVQVRPNPFTGEPIFFPDRPIDDGFPVGDGDAVVFAHHPTYGPEQFDPPVDGVTCP